MWWGNGNYLLISAWSAFAIAASWHCVTGIVYDYVTRWFALDLACARTRDSVYAFLLLSLLMLICLQRIINSFGMNSKMWMTGKQKQSKATPGFYAHSGSFNVNYIHRCVHCACVWNATSKQNNYPAFAWTWTCALEWAEEVSLIFSCAFF